MSDKPLNEEEEKTTHRSSLHLKNFYKKSVASFVMGFKQAVTRSYRTKIDNQKYEMWQPRFYENIIRSEKSLFSLEIIFKIIQSIGKLMNIRKQFKFRDDRWVVLKSFS
ncbi:MAG: hypothetical protein ACOVNU_06315 [Candidatus Kapaibacteriota bacterium]